MDMLDNNNKRIDGTLFSEDFDFTDIMQRFEKDVMPLFESRDKKILKQMMRMLQDDNSIFCYNHYLINYQEISYFKSTKIVIEDGEESEKRWSFQFSFDSSLFVIGFGGFLLDNDEVYHRFSMANHKVKLHLQYSFAIVCRALIIISHSIN